MEFKTLSIEDLKKDYSGRHGFVFAGVAPSNKDHCDKVSDAIKYRGYTTASVEFVVQLNPTVFIFVYPEGITFDCPSFISESRIIGGALGRSWQTDTLASFLKTH